MKNNSNILASNRKAFADYEVLEKIEAGMVLIGAEVKSIRAGHVNLKGSHLEITKNGEAMVTGMHISPFKQANLGGDYNPDAKRKLLLKKQEILKIEENIDTKGITAVPLDIHLSHNYIKMTIGICKGKKQYDRRADLKKKAQNLEIKRTLARY